MSSPLSVSPTTIGVDFRFAARIPIAEVYERMPLSESIIGLRYEDRVRGEMAPSESFMRNAVMVRYRNSADGNCETVKFFTSGIHVSSRKTVVEAEPIAMAVLAAIAAICPAEIECYELTMLRWNGELLRPVKRLQLADLCIATRSETTSSQAFFTIRRRPYLPS